MVEQLTLNQRVAGSSPARFTKFFDELGSSGLSPTKLLLTKNTQSVDRDPLHKLFAQAGLEG